jgi:hypothetical protein
MWTENPAWGEDQIAGQLAKLGHYVSPGTVSKYRPARLPRGRGQKWSTFVRNHISQTWAVDWFTIVTLRFQVLYALVILDLGRREIVRVGVTSTPSAQYAAQTFVDAVCDCDDQAPRFLIHDRDSIYGSWGLVQTSPIFLCVTSEMQMSDNLDWTKPLARQLGGRARDGHRGGAGFHPDLTSSRGISIVSTRR